jgi:hypothetical protein
MNKAVTKILTHLVREAMKDPKVRRHAEEIAKAASQKAAEVAKVVYAGASEWLRQRQSSAKSSGPSNRGTRAAPAKKPANRKSVAKKAAGKKTAVRNKRPKRESPPQE